MFKVGDRVRIIATEERLSAISISSSYDLTEGTIKNIGGGDLPIYADTGEKGGGYWYFAERDLELVEQPGCCLTVPTGSVRTFESGATRDTDLNKLDYEAFLSPLVLKRYAEYLNKHRRQSDGTIRAGDNWQKGIPKTEYMKSAFRHFMTWWTMHRSGQDFSTEDFQDSMCALMFNVMGYLHEELIDCDD